MNDDKPDEKPTTPVTNELSTSDEKIFDTYEQSETAIKSQFSGMAFDQDPKVDFAPLLLAEAFTRDDMQIQFRIDDDENGETKCVSNLKEMNKGLNKELFKVIGTHKTMWLSKEFDKFVDASFEPWLQTRLLKTIPDSDPKYREKRVAMTNWLLRKFRLLLDMKVIPDVSRHGVTPMTEEKK